MKKQEMNIERKSTDTGKGLQKGARRMLAAFLAVCMAVSLTGCGMGGGNKENGRNEGNDMAGGTEESGQPAAERGDITDSIPLQVIDDN